MSLAIKYIIWFVGLLLLQVFVLNNLHLGGYMNPFVYVLIVLSLPFNVSGWLLLGCSFVAGYIVDLFMNTPGMHAAATVFMGFLRPWVLRWYYPHTEFVSGEYPNLREMGISSFFGYTLTLVFIHHLSLFTLELMSFRNFHLTLLRTLLSTGFSLLVIFIACSIFQSRTKQS